MSQSHTSMLIFELVYDIILEAWSTIDTKRRDFYRAISLTSSIWHACISAVALRRVIIASRNDFAVYRSLITRRFGVDPNSHDGERVHPDAVQFFQRSELHIIWWTWPSPGWAPSDSKGTCMRIASYVPTCKFINVVVKEVPSRRVLPSRMLFEFLEQYSPASDLRLDWSYSHMNRHVLFAERTRGMTDYLRMHQFPRCECRSYGDNTAEGHNRDCFFFYLPILFPSLSHIHLDVPVPLAPLSGVPTLSLLTIEAPPMHYYPRFGHFSSLLGWNIPSALDMGLLRGSSSRKKIIVSMGSCQEPNGWHQVLASCTTHGVELELRC